MIDRAELLTDLKAALTTLEDDIRARIDATDELAASLRAEHARATGAGRTAMALAQWREGEITQAAVAWILGCVFVRFLEDNELVDTPLLSGPGLRRTAALGYRDEYFRAHPQHSDRELLEHLFGEVARFPAVAALYDRRHNPLWRLGPAADGAKALRELWTAIDPDTGDLSHDFTDPELGTRFLGDLYEDLSKAAQKRYALHQTPVFVEEFILDRTLDPAIAEFGLGEVRMIDPTCGSGHFLIGGFRRLFGLWREREPGTTSTVLAQRALDAIHGVDVNPYATAIARFRLLVEALKACDIRRLAEAPDLRPNLATGDSLLHGAVPGALFGGAVTHREGIAHAFETEDPDELRRIFGQGYHAVVGNPPYIAVQDSALRDAYRHRYDTCYDRYVMTVPFMERFFELAAVEAANGQAAAGFVGKITGNNFMKREFGAPLVERFLPSVDVQTVIDASGAYIPGHGTPTVILFGRQRGPVGTALRVVDGVRGEPRQPADPARGEVWTSITRLVDTPGEEDRFVRVSDIAREELSTHPMTLGIGRELRRALEGRAADSIADFATHVGITAVNGEDDAYTAPTPRQLSRLRVHRQRPLIVGKYVRNWMGDPIAAIWTFSDDFEVVVPEPGSGESRVLWQAKPIIRHRKRFGTPMVDRGLAWFEWQELYADKLRTPLTITWGEVATHNHFVLDRGGKVFKQTAPVIKLPEGAGEDEHLALLGVLNSSVACFWLRQVCQPKGGAGIGRGIHDEPWESRHAFNAENVKDLPLPERRDPVLARALDVAADERATLLDDLDRAPLRDHLTSLQVRDVELRLRMISLQEELDWQVLASYGLVSEDLPVLGDAAPPIALGQRAFEVVLARQVAAGETETTWFERHGSTPITELPADWPDGYRDLVQRRIDLIESDADIGLVERAEHKRRWTGRSWEDRRMEALRSLVLDALEAAAIWSAGELRSSSQLADTLRADPRLIETVELLAGDRDADVGATVQRLVLEEAVPHLAALRLTDKGLRKRAVWEEVWELQRQEDAIDARAELAEGDADRLAPLEAQQLKAEQVGTIPIPPRYAKADFRPGSSWTHRGKLDVPKERFVLHPDAGRGADPSPVVGWAGWDERDRARALAGRLLELREHDAADAQRLTPLLAGLLELLPWIHQWHADPEPAYGGTPGVFFEAFLDQQLSELGLTREALRAWRPPR